MKDSQYKTVKKRGAGQNTFKFETLIWRPYGTHLISCNKKKRGKKMIKREKMKPLWNIYYMYKCNPMITGLRCCL